MPSRKQSVVWKALPHTIAKIQILTGYLHAWFQIMGRTMGGKELVYIDGFTGPGEYTNHPTGSPLAAVEAAKAMIDAAGEGWRAGNIHCAFIEPDRDRFANLQARLQPFQETARLRIHCLNSTFVEGLSILQTQLRKAFEGSYPLLVFIDPFGATGAPFTVVSRLLRSSLSEVLINLDADGILRVFRAGEVADCERILGEVFGDGSWKNELSSSLSDRDLCAHVLDLYKRRLRSLPGVRYVFAFEMRDQRDTHSCFLVFASQHARGLEKMKEAMKRLDQDGSYRFTDAHILQETLFRFDDTGEWSLRLHKEFFGKKVGWSELNAYALNESPFVNPKKMLQALEGNSRIQVASRDPKRRKGTFNEEKIDHIEFV